MMDLIELTKLEKIKLLEKQYPNLKFDVNKDAWINTKIKKELDLNYSEVDFYKISDKERENIIKKLSLSFESYFLDFVIEDENYINFRKSKI